MQCPTCGFDNPAKMKFCGECGTPLRRHCLNCDFDNPLSFKFCGQCGVSLVGSTPSPLSHLTPRQPEPIQPISTGLVSQETKAERRRLTVIFCDLVGSTPLAEQLDPEDLREVMRAYQHVCNEVVSQFEGYIAQYLGDGLLIYFGYPQAHEDDPQRAVRTGLGIIAAMEQLNQRLQPHLNLKLAVRLGIHTGLVVVGEIGEGERREQLAVGEAVNIAARLQDLTEPNTILISTPTYRLVRNVFACRELGAQTLKGFSQPLLLYRVLRERRVRSPRPRSASQRLSPLVGREQEVALLGARWEQAQERQGQVVLLNGEAGIGKSRLLQLLRERVSNEPHFWLEGHCSAYYQQSALYPVIELLRQLLRFRSKDSSLKKLEKLEWALAQTGFSTPETVPLLANLLSLPLPEHDPPLNLTPQRQKQATFALLLGMAQQLALRQPLILVVEDLHWIDPSTLELLSLLVDQVPTTPILALFTFRPQFSPPWVSHSHLTQLTLGRLAQRQTQTLIEQMVGGKALPPEVLQQLIAKTDGVPLFVEELTKMVLELELLQEREDHYELSSPLPPLAIPATLHDSLMARLDRLATVREVAQLGATIGREFSYELLRAISPLDEPTLQRDLARLVEAELLYQQGLPPQATYIFKHALIQETAYRSLLRSKRQQYHHQIAQALAERFPEVVAAQPELLAHHYTLAGLNQQAVNYWQQAGTRAIERSANLEAIDHLTQAVTLLKTLPETPERIQQELALLISLGGPLQVTKGYAALAVEQAYAQARELAQQVGETPQLFSALFGLWVFYLVRAELQTARELGEQLMRVARRLQEVVLLLEAHQIQGVNLFYLGEITTAQTHLEYVISSYDPQHHRSHASYGGADVGVICLSHAALALWLRGYPDQALQRSQAALTLAQELAQPFSQAFALCFTAWLHQYRREVALTQERAEAAVALSAEHEFALSRTFGHMLRSWALAEPHHDEASLTQIRSALLSYQATGAELGRLYFLLLLVETQRQMGEIEEGLALLAEAQDMLSHNGERFYEAELYRLKGELLRQTEDEAQAEQCFRQAMEVARNQQAKSLELRAAMSLSRLWQRQGRLAAAYQALAEIYNWFSEGFETADLREAKALLEEMNVKRKT